MWDNIRNQCENFTIAKTLFTIPVKPRQYEHLGIFFYWSAFDLVSYIIELARIQKHDTKLEQINLNKSNPEIEFKLNSEDSYLMIHSVSVTSQKNFQNEWTNFISQIKLTAELKYVVFDDQQGCFIDERKNQFPIHLLVDPYQVQPVFQLNKLIKNETFTLGINPERKFYRTLKLALLDAENLNEDYSLEFNIEKFNLYS